MRALGGYKDLELESPEHLSWSNFTAIVVDGVVSVQRQLLSVSVTVWDVGTSPNAL